MPQEILIFDRDLLLKKRSRAILDKADFLIKRSFDDILEKLNDMSRDFPSILNLDCRSPYGSKKLASRKGTKILIEGDLSINSAKLPNNHLKFVTDQENLALGDNQFDLIISILNLHSINDLPGYLIQLRNTLKPNGVLMASMFGEINLPELSRTLIKTELECLGGLSPRTLPMVELKQMGMLLQRAGFNTPVIDKDHIEVHYSHPLELLQDLRNMGETNIMLNRSKKYTGKEFWRKFSANYIKDFSKSGQCIASFEILTMMAIKG